MLVLLCLVSYHSFEEDCIFGDVGQGYEDFSRFGSVEKGCWKIEEAIDCLT